MVVRGKIYKNKYNGNKYIVTKHYSDCHYVVAQFIETPNGIRNWGTVYNRRRLNRIHRKDIHSLCKDYEYVADSIC